MKPRSLLALAAALGTLVGAGCRGGGESSVSIADFAGLEQALEARRGEGFLLNLWATWCPPCVAELPELVEVVRAAKTKEPRLLTVSYDLMIPGVDATTIESTVRDFLEGRGLDMTVLIYDEPDFAAIDARFDLPGEIPVTLAIDATGAIVDREHGQASKARFEEMLSKALGK